MFVSSRLHNFGDYQDAMIEGEPWMYHSHIGFYLNCGLLLPLECVKAVEEAEATGAELPENIQKLMDFMEDTGGDLEDYVKLNKDISKLNDNDVLHEYYKQTKSHLTNDEINFLMEDQFSYDEEVDDERDIKRNWRLKKRSG